VTDGLRWIGNQNSVTRANQPKQLIRGDGSRFISEYGTTLTPALEGLCDRGRKPMQRIGLPSHRG
jgi:hypothetical protein